MAEIIGIDNLVEKFKKELITEGKKQSDGFLLSVQSGHAPDAEAYIRSQKKMAEKIGVDFRLCRLESSLSSKEAFLKVKQFSNDKEAKGIIINKPFPSQWNSQEIFSAISPNKDIEGVSPYNLGRIFYGNPCFISPTVLAILAILRFLNLDLYGKDVAIVGSSSLIGKPLALLLSQEFATVSITHIATYKKQMLPFYLQNSDIVISAVGKPGLIKGEWIKKGAVVIDVGISRQGSALSGDVDFEEVAKKASYITPVPGGVGRLTTLFLFKNFFKARCLTDAKH